MGLHVTGDERNFNPRSREGSDQSEASDFPASPYFNPRSREGSDPNRLNISDTLSISIHAPARGATFYAIPSVPLFGISIHAPARGATLSADNLFVTWNISIHAPARGATVASASIPCLGIYFNPRSREGSDKYP